MLIHNTLEGVSTTHSRLAYGHATRPPRSPLRMLAEALWIAIWHGAQGAVHGLFLFGLAMSVRRERAALGRMDDRELADVGIDRATAKHESARHWLDLPASRR